MRISIWNPAEESNNNLDYCRKCWDSGAAEEHADVTALNDCGEETGFRYPVACTTAEVIANEPDDHPEYGDEFFDYDCECCGVKLTNCD
jgi:hypothetical protein